MSLAHKAFSIFQRDVLLFATRLVTGIIVARTLGPVALGIFTILSLVPSYAEAFGRLKVDVASVYFMGQKTFRREDILFNLNLIALASVGTILAIILSCLGMLIYIAFRFEFRYGIGGVLALVHDTIITIGALSLLNKEFTLAVVAALLTIIGYSINDTIVVFDRIRENRKKDLRTKLAEVINASINETLSRTVLTSLTVILVLVVLFFLGGPVIHDFSFALLVGVIVGTYSSIFIASPLVLFFDRPKLPKGKGKK